MVRNTFLRLVLAAAFACPIAARANMMNLDKCADGRFMGLELAIDYCTRAIKSGELSGRAVASAYYNRGLYYSRQGRHDLGLRDLSEAIRIESVAPEPDDTRAMSYAVRGSIHFARKNYDAALTDYDEAVRLDPRFGDAYLRRGQTWIAKRDPDRALADFALALKNDVPDATQFGGAGTTYRQGRPRNFDRSAHDSACHLGRAYAYQLKNDPAAARAAVDEAIRIDARNHVAFKTRAAMHEQRADYAEAIADYSAALRQNPRDAAGLYSRGRAWAAKGEYASGAQDFDEALRLEPRHHAARLSRAFLAVGDGRYEQAADQFTDVLRQIQPRAYLVLWKHVASARAGGEKSAGARDELARDSAGLSERSTQAQLIELYLGRGDEAALRRPGRSLGEVCETDYFLAQRSLIGGDKARGVELLRGVAKQCPAMLQESWAARLELRRLDGAR